MNNTSIPLNIVITKMYDIQNVFIIIPDFILMIIVWMIKISPILIG